MPAPAAGDQGQRRPARGYHTRPRGAAYPARGGALFCDRRYGRVFVYHNGAQSYYAARGFRGVLVV